MILRRPRSLIARILLAEGVTILVAALLLPVLLITVLHQTAIGYQNDILLAQARAVAAGLEVDARGDPHVRLSSALQPIFATGYDGRGFLVLDARGRRITGSLYAGDIPAAEVPRLDVATRFRTGQFVGVSLPIAGAAGRRWVIVSQDERGPGAILDDVSQAFLWRYLALLLPILLLLPLVNSLAIRRLVLRVRAVSNDAADIGADSLHVRLDESGVPEEVAPLVRATNRLLDRLEAGFRQQGEFVANVAHELRTPLAVLRIGLDAIENDVQRETLDGQVERLSHVISQLRDLAALERVGIEEAETVDLYELALDTIAELAPTILNQSHSIELQGETEVRVVGNRTLIGLALVNLIVNAVRHTPAGTAILVGVAADGSLSVADDGPGITTQDAGQLTQRFWRADRARSDSAGLGLSIVQRIIDVHRGALTIGRPVGGGVIFTLCLHPAPRRAPRSDDS